MKLINNFNKPPLYSFLVSVILLLLTACTIKGETPPKKTTIPRINTLSVNEYWPQVKEMAQSWQADAYLLTVRVDVKLPRVATSENKVSFTFRSPSEAQTELGVVCDRTCTSREATTTVQLPQCLPLDLNVSLLESEQALELGIDSGGSNYINSEKAWVFLYLERNYPRCNGSRITWRITFRNFVTSKRVIYIIDAVSGELIETR